MDLKRNERRPEVGKAHRRWAAENEAGLEGANRRFARGRQVQDGPQFSQRSEKIEFNHFQQAKRKRSGRMAQYLRNEVSKYVYITSYRPNGSKRRMAQKEASV